MKLLHKNTNLTINTLTCEKTYNDVTFGNGFRNFLDSLILDHLIPPDSVREKTPFGFRWSNNNTIDQVVFETSKHPLVTSNLNAAGDVRVKGTKQAIELFEMHLKKHSVWLGDNDIQKKVIPLAVDFHSTLNPMLWKKQPSGQYVLLDDVKQHLIKSARSFITFLDLPKLKIEDIIVTGSSTSYSYTEFSDLDLHVVINEKQAEQAYGSLIMRYFTAQKIIWNIYHHITIREIPVEFYVQSSTQKHISQGVYSVKRDKWLQLPDKTVPTVDTAAIRAKVEDYMEEITNLVANCNDAETIEKLVKKIQRMRQSGLSNKGVYSVENIVFKTLRNTGFLDKLFECKTKILDRMLSIEDEEWCWDSAT